MDTDRRQKLILKGIWECGTVANNLNLSLTCMSVNALFGEKLTLLSTYIL